MLSFFIFIENIVYFLCYDLIYMFKVCYNVCVFLICIREILFYNEFMVWICNIMLYKFVIKFVKEENSCLKKFIGWLFF